MTRLVAAAVAICAGPEAFAQSVEGRVEAAAAAPKAKRPEGHVRVRATEPSEVSPGPERWALFLAVKDTLPLEAAPPQTISFGGMAFAPAVVACAHEGSIVLRNDDAEPVHFLLGAERIGPVAPGAQVEHTCAIGEKEGLRPLRVAEWPHAEGGIYVAGNGAPGLTDENGRFSIPAAKGTYELRVIRVDGVALRKDVELGAGRTSAGTLRLEGGR